MSSGLVPVSPPTPSKYLAQRAGRLRLAVEEIRTKLDEIEKSLRAVKTDLILVLAALDDVEAERSQLERSA
jgi:hypothetical protein